MRNNGKQKRKRQSQNSKIQNSISKKDEVQKDAKSSEYNDASWYTRNSQLALDAGRIAFTWPTGAPIRMNKTSLDPNITGVDYNSNLAMPGVMALEFVPTYGLTTSGTDPVNVSAKNIYSWVRHANSGHSNYDAPDLMLYLLAVDNIYMLYQYACRIYGLLRMYAQKNRHLPQSIFEACEIDYIDFLNNMADFRAFINTTAVKIGSLCVPNTMPLFTRHAWMCSGIYADSPSIKSQFYIYTPLVVGRYVETNGAGYLEPVGVKPNNNKQTFSSLVTLINSLISAVISSEDMNIMSGDILKAYGEEGLLKISQISEDYMVAPSYNEEVLRQIQNATILDKIISFPNNPDGYPSLIYQDITNNILVAGYTMPVTYSEPYSGKLLMTGTSENPDPSEVLVNSRLMLAGEIVATPSGLKPYEFNPSSIGSEAISFVNVCTLKNDGTYYVSSTGMQLSNFDQISLISMFNYHPMFMWRTSNGVTVKLNTVFDLDNYAIVDEHDIEKLHTTSMLSLFDVPQIGRI